LWRFSALAAEEERKEKRMDEIKISAETLEEAGAAMGFMFAAFVRGFKEGMDAFEVMEAANDIKEVHETEEPLKRDPVKTEIGDCRKCWCDQCARLEECEKIREGYAPDGIRPSPCVGCADGMRFKPCEEPQCEEFVRGEGLNNG